MRLTGETPSFYLHSPELWCILASSDTALADIGKCLTAWAVFFFRKALALNQHRPVQGFLQGLFSGGAAILILTS